MNNPNHDFDEYDNHDDDDRSATNYVVLIVVAIIVLIGCIVVFEMKKETTREDCYAAGRKDCAPIDTSGSQ